MGKIKVYITPTTHWDREWVMPFGQFQVRLVNLLDNVLNIMESSLDYRFLLDGQAIALEDYLEIKPEQRERISSLMKQNKLVAGPWYVLADQFLENGESTIRNLLIGMDTVRQLGGKPMMLGYIPDSFGSIASMPMILHGFNIRYTSFGRGRPYWNGQLPKVEFWWEGPDGSKVLAVNHGYGNGLFLSYLDIWTDIMLPSSFQPDPDVVLSRFLEESKEQQEQAATANLYFSVGVDHMEPRQSLPELVKYINEHQDEYELVYGMPEDYLEAVRQDAGDLSSYIGEMRGSDEKPMDLVGTLSSYIPLKQENDACELLLQRVVEPLWAMVSSLTGIENPKGHLLKMWKLLLANHPHDSICGCSVDQVHKDMQNRYEQIHSISDYLIKDGLHHLLSNINTTFTDGNAIALTVVNPLGRTHSGPVRGLVRVPKRFKFSEYSLVDSTGKTIPSKVLHRKDKNKDLESVYMTNVQLDELLSKDSNEERHETQVFTVLEVDFMAEDVPEMGYKTFWLKPCSSEKGAMSGVKLCESGMENNDIKVSFNGDGSFNMLNKRTGHIFNNLNYFVDREETGNLYDHHEFTVPEEFDSRDCIVNWQVYEQETYRIKYKAVIPWELPQAVETDKRSKTVKAMQITMYATLYANTDRLEIAVELDNECKDHCLRVAFETGLRTQTVSAYDHFNVIERNVRASSGEWRDEPFQEFIDVSDGMNGLCISTRGLPAYETVRGETGTRVFLTLLRSAGRLGPAAGADYAAPGGQCQGPHRFEYAIFPHEGNWMKGDCLNKAVDYRIPLLMEADLQHEGKLPSTGSFLSVSSNKENHPHISCLKQAEDGSGWILRLWNPGDMDQIRLKSDFKMKDIKLANLDESTKHPLNLIEDIISLPARGLTTIRIHIEGAYGR